ncbi:hypothetical protein TNCV_3343571 [Trichonephila clavipes]|nr:hypothetical protein TNCV_3343571 [Trichonephila clavipes]
MIENWVASSESLRTTGLEEYCTILHIDISKVWGEVLLKVINSVLNAGQDRCLTPFFCSSNHCWTSHDMDKCDIIASKLHFRDDISGNTFPPTGNKFCNIRCTWTAKIYLYFSPVILPFRVMIGPA